MQSRPGTVKPSKQEEFTAPVLDFEVPYVPKKKPEMSFVLKTLQKSNAQAVLKFLTDGFVEYEPTGMILGFTWEDYNVYIRFQVEKSVQLQTGVVMYDTKTGEIVGALVCEDLYDPSNCEEKANAISDSYKQKMVPFSKFLNKPENQLEFFATPKSRYSSIEFSSAVVPKKYQDCGIAQKMTVYVMFEHAYTSNADRFMGCSVSAMGNTHAQRSGWKLLKDLPYTDWEVDGVKVFTNLEEIQKKHGLPPTSSLQFWGFEMNQTDPSPAL
jgi:hypothetical protein